jgi:hypothetical protein
MPTLPGWVFDFLMILDALSLVGAAAACATADG